MHPEVWHGFSQCCRSGVRLRGRGGDGRAERAGWYADSPVGDPRAYPGGDRFDITVVRDAALLQFGAGPHYCVGAALARAELAEALPILAGRFSPPVITGDVTRRPALGIHGPNELPLRLAVPA